MAVGKTADVGDRMALLEELLARADSIISGHGTESPDAWRRDYRAAVGIEEQLRHSSDPPPTRKTVVRRPESRKRMVEESLKADPRLTKRNIDVAREFGVDPSVISVIRKKLGHVVSPEIAGRYPKVVSRPVSDPQPPSMLHGLFDKDDGHGLGLPASNGSAAREPPVDVEALWAESEADLRRKFTVVPVPDRSFYAFRLRRLADEFIRECPGTVNRSGESIPC
jgi:hypothetical protein